MIAAEIINESMANNYAGLFPLKKEIVNSSSPKNPTSGKYSVALTAMNEAKERIRQRIEKNSDNGSH